MLLEGQEFLHCDTKKGHCNMHLPYKAPWELFFMVIAKKKACWLRNVGSNKPTTKESHVDIALEWWNSTFRIAK
jgi:hypothetical protein